MKITTILSLFLLSFCFFLSISCNENENQQNTEAKVEISEASGTAQMVERLKKFTESASPRDNYHLNAAIADALVEQAKGTNLGGERFQYLAKAALEYLQAGQTSKTISMLAEMESTSGIPSEVNQITKNFYLMQAMAFLRQGEQDNCLDNHGPKNCLLPLAAEGFHKKKEGSEAAIEKFTRIVEAFPEDHQSLYLLNLAYITLGKYPDAVPSKYLIKNIGGRKTDFPYFDDIAGKLGIDEMALSGGTCIDDFDGDGDLDIFASSYGFEDQLKYYENTGSSFEDKTAQTGLSGITGGLNMIHADYDNDGDNDILVLRGGWLDKGGKLPNSLVENLGNGKFQDATIESGLYSLHPTQTAAWADFDLDGDLDVFIGNEAGAERHLSEYFRNNGDKTFSSISDFGLKTIGKVKGCTVVDYNNDGWPDLFLSVLGSENVLYKNVNGKFAAVQNLEPKFSFPTWSWDVNNDGHEDLMVFSYDVRAQRELGGEYARELMARKLQSDQNRIFINDGNGKYADASSRYKIDNMAGWTMGCNFGDLNNDGWLDFYMGTGAPDMGAVIPNRMFLSKKGSSFEDVTASGGFGHIQKGHGVAFADIDRDGDQDIYAVMGGAFEGDTYHNVCFENPGFNNNYIVLKLIGSTSNKSAIGARVTISINENGKERRIHRTVNTGGSFGSSPLQLHVGVGSAEKINFVKVKWPNKNRTESRYTDLPVNSSIVITEGKDSFEEQSYKPIKFSKSKSAHKHHHH